MSAATGPLATNHMEGNRTLAMWPVAPRIESKQGWIRHEAHMWCRNETSRQLAKQPLHPCPARTPLLPVGTEICYGLARTRTGSILPGWAPADADEVS